MATRSLQSSQPSAVGVSLVAASVGAAITFTVLLSSMITTMDGRQTPDVLPGQVIVNAREGVVHSPADPEALRTVQALAATDRGAAVQLRFTNSPDPNDLKRTVSVLGAEEEPIMAVDSIAQARALLGSRWEGRFASVLRSGGMVRWFNGEEGEEVAMGGDRVTLAYAAGNREPLAKLDSFNTVWPRVNWARGVAGLALTSTLRKKGISVRDGELIFTGAPDSLATEMKTALAREGLDQDLVVGYVEPPPAIPPVGLAITGIFLTTIALLMITVSTAGRVAELRPTLGVLLANGVPPNWIRQVLLLQETIVLAVGTAIGVVFGSLPIVASLPRFSGFWVISLPWAQMASLVFACILGCGAAALVAAYRLRPTTSGRSTEAQI